VWKSHTVLARATDPTYIPEKGLEQSSPFFVRNLHEVHRIAGADMSCRGQCVAQKQRIEGSEPKKILFHRAMQQIGRLSIP
jgi:hypothetical protein